MGLRWHIPLPGPFSIGGPVFTRYFSHRGCMIRHRTREAAARCKVRPSAELTDYYAWEATQRPGRRR